MSGKSKEKIATETFELRSKMRKLIDSGITEKEALKEVLPHDKNRTVKLNLWKRKGLFPMPENEREVHEMNAVKITTEVLQVTPEIANSQGLENDVTEAEEEVYEKDGIEIEVHDTSDKTQSKEQVHEQPHEVTCTSLSLHDFTEQEIDILKAMINERIEAKDQSKHDYLPYPDHCPSFKVPSGSTSLRLRRDFIAAAEERAKKLWPSEHVSQTQLLNFLLWRFAGLSEEDALKGP